MYSKVKKNQNFVRFERFYWLKSFGNLELEIWKKNCIIFNIKEDFTSMLKILSWFLLPVFRDFWQNSSFYTSETTLNSLFTDSDIFLNEPNSVLLQSEENTFIS